ncbi:hypothetical protein ALC56_07073 [Trachymyrmex septentrionalis]|uniref:Uncharacterized protein n=1 Tax=Trachymyrmex septentrionalis TaxID=34720 RepID=A0A195FD57_9HYME|nr:hypothetical protein ALC56_07073 [Trachymyrmex septentrionalis]
MESWVSRIARKATATHIQLTLTSPSAHVSPGNIITGRETRHSPLVKKKKSLRLEHAFARTVEKAGGAPVATAGWRLVAVAEQLSLDGTLENKNNPAQRDMCEEEKERVRKEEQEKGETPDGAAGL